MAGRHEPGSPSSFYLSLGTATLRAILVIAAVAVGFFVLSKAFPGASPATAPVPPSPPAGETTGPTESPTDGGTPETPEETDTPQIRGVTVQILNGTAEDGLAASYEEQLKNLGYRVPTVGNANQAYETSQIFFHKDYRADAQYLRREVLNQAQLERASNNVEEVNITVVLGDDAIR